MLLRRQFLGAWLTLQTVPVHASFMGGTSEDGIRIVIGAIATEFLAQCPAPQDLRIRATASSSPSNLTSKKTLDAAEP